MSPSRQSCLKRNNLRLSLLTSLQYRSVPFMYEPELVNYLTMICTVFLAVFWATCFIHGLINEKIEPLQFSDKFDIGYIESDEPVVTKPPKAKKKKKKKKSKRAKPKSQAKPKPKAKPELKPKPKPEPVKPTVDDALMRDCCSALVSLGTSRSESKRAAKEFLLSNPDIKTVEQFIEGIFKK